tara:strand:+ start:1125 stop:2378 length:1254 start_codon:yes stop_codon:yes gene_type:complete
MKKFYLGIFWLLSIIFSIIWSYEHPEKIESLKSSFKKDKKPQIINIDSKVQTYIANSFEINSKKIIEFKEKTAFVIYPKKEKIFNKEKLKIYIQNGFIIENFKQNKLNLPKYFTLQRNGGIKTIISVGEDKIALISGKEKNCFFAALVHLKKGKELMRTKCLPEIPKNNDFNGLGSSNIHLNDFVYFTLGTPEKHISKNSPLAQDDDYLFGKVIRIKKSDVLKKIDNQIENLKINIFSKGHRVPQGLTRINKSIFNVEHGPKGGDELNLVIKNGNYGWPLSSYGTNYLKENGGNGKSINSSHELNNFNEPLLALVPSIGISSLNNCPKILNNYYKKKCLIALSLYGNNLRKGHSIIIFLLNDMMTKVDSFEIIKLDNLILRHFVTNELNELYEDQNGDMYVSADKKGIYKISFSNFR